MATAPEVQGQLMRALQDSVETTFQIATALRLASEPELFPQTQMVVRQVVSYLDWCQESAEEANEAQLAERVAQAKGDLQAVLDKWTYADTDV